MTLGTAERFAVPLGMVILLVMPAFVAFAADEAPAQQTIQLGLSYADLGDFGTNWGMRARWSFDNWLVAGGWNDVKKTVASTAGPMAVKGDLWQLDLSYVWWTLNAEPEERPSTPDFYYGLGVGLASVDADWTLAGITADAKETSFAGHVVAGAQWKQVFADLRYNFATDYWDFDSDGVQFSVGAVWPLR